MLITRGLMEMLSWAPAVKLQIWCSALFKKSLKISNACYCWFLLPSKPEKETKLGILRISDPSPPSTVGKQREVGNEG